MAVMGVLDGNNGGARFVIDLSFCIVGLYVRIFSWVWSR